MNKTLIAFLLSTLYMTPAFAKDPIFVSPEQSRPVEVLSTPAADGSEKQQKELAELHKIEAARTAAEAAHAQWDDENEHIFLFKTVLGENFSAENLPLTAALSKKIENDEAVNGSVAKAHFHREHPYNVDKTLKTICKTKTKADSYPSGHTLLGWLLGLTLVEMVPEKRDEIIARAEDYGHSRMVCGLHYKSDLQASKLIAYTVHAIMKQNPEYLKELSAAKTETRTLLGLSNLPK